MLNDLGITIKDEIGKFQFDYTHTLKNRNIIIRKKNKQGAGATQIAGYHFEKDFYEAVKYIHDSFKHNKNIYLNESRKLNNFPIEWGFITESKIIKPTYELIIWTNPREYPEGGKKLKASIAIRYKKDYDAILKQHNLEFITKKLVTAKNYYPIGMLSKTCDIVSNIIYNGNWLYFFPKTKEDVDLVFDFIESLADFGLIRNKPIEVNGRPTMEKEIIDIAVSSVIDSEIIEQELATVVTEEIFEDNEVKYEVDTLGNSYSDFETIKDEFEINQIDFENEVSFAFKLSQEDRNSKLNSYPEIPTQSTVAHQVFIRNPYVVAEVLFRAKGICEKCNSDAPFIRDSNGTPYLEVHHRIPLSEGGFDTVENSHALCPNCHRHAHYGKNTYNIK